MKCNLPKILKESIEMWKDMGYQVISRDYTNDLEIPVFGHIENYTLEIIRIKEVISMSTNHIKMKKIIIKQLKN